MQPLPFALIGLFCVIVALGYICVDNKPHSGEICVWSEVFSISLIQSCEGLIAWMEYGLKKVQNASLPPK